jgi:hypothetical protein
LIFGRSLIGQRVTDILAITGALAGCTGQNRQIAVAALDELTVPALFATAIDSSIASLYLAGGLCSYASIMENADYDHPFANFVVGILMHTDLPEIVAGIAPRKVVIAQAVDGRGTPLALTRATEVYSSALSRQHLTIRERADWTANGLASFLSSTE